MCYRMWDFAFEEHSGAARRKRRREESRREEKKEGKIERTGDVQQQALSGGDCEGGNAGHLTGSAGLNKRSDEGRCGAGREGGVVISSGVLSGQETGGWRHG